MFSSKSKTFLIKAVKIFLGNYENSALPQIIHGFVNENYFSKSMISKYDWRYKYMTHRFIFVGTIYYGQNCYICECGEAFLSEKLAKYHHQQNALQSNTNSSICADEVQENATMEKLNYDYNAGIDNNEAKIIEQFFSPNRQQSFSENNNFADEEQNAITSEQNWSRNNKDISEEKKYESSTTTDKIENEMYMTKPKLLPTPTLSTSKEKLWWEAITPESKEFIVAWIFEMYGVIDNYLYLESCATILQTSVTEMQEIVDTYKKGAYKISMFSEDVKQTAIKLHRNVTECMAIAWKEVDSMTEEELKNSKYDLFDSD